MLLDTPAGWTQATHPGQQLQCGLKCRLMYQPGSSQRWTILSSAGQGGSLVCRLTSKMVGRTRMSPEWLISTLSPASNSPGVRRPLL